MTQTPEFRRRLIVAVDAKGYGGSDELTQHEIQAAIPALLDAAAERSGLDRSEWDVHPAGDGEMAVLPLSTEEPRFLDLYVQELSYALRRHNHNRTEAGRLRLRLAVHHGSAVSSAAGYSGRGIVTAARVVDSDTLRDALAGAGADLAVAVTAPVYQDVVVQGHSRLRPEDFVPASVRNKEYGEPVWIHVPGRSPAAAPGPVEPTGTAGTPGSSGSTAAGSPAADASAQAAPAAAPASSSASTTSPSGSPGGPPTAPPSPAEAPDSGPELRPSPAITNVMNAPVDARGAVFGIQNQERS
jgi:hypothetical protein